MKELDKDALLEEAKRRYPIGTKFKTLSDNKVLEVEKTIYLSSDNKTIWNGNGHGRIYHDGDWAEIVEEPKVETKFEVGKWYKCTCNSNFYKCSGETSNYFICSEVINPTKKPVDTYAPGHHTAITHKGCKEYFKEKVSLEEIQQYLPDGHPDLIKEEFVLPEYWFLRFKTKEVFDELCKKYDPDFIFFENAGICNNPTKLKLGNYHYLTKDTKYGEEITFEQFKKYVLCSNKKLLPLPGFDN